MTDKGRQQILSYVTENVQKTIKSLFNKVSIDREFEFIFFSKKENNMSKEKYILLLKYMSIMAKSKKLEVSTDRTLDISYSLDKEKTYRLTVDGIDDINKMINRIYDIQDKNYVIYKFMLYSMIKNRNYKIGLLMKEKESTVDIDELNMRVRLSRETNLSNDVKGKEYAKLDGNIRKLISGEKLDLDTRKVINNSIIYRLKDRTTLYLDQDEDHFIKVDLTNTKTTSNVRKINTIHSNYELEIEYGVKKSKKSSVNNGAHLDKMYNIAETLLKLLQQSSYIIGNSLTNDVILYYKEMAGINFDIKNLVARQPESLEIQHVTEILPNRYAVTDKADGERYFLIIYKNIVYLISGNLNVKNTGIVLDKKYAKYNGTIMDGEYIYISEQRRHLFMIFDCLRSGSNDIRSVVSLQERLNYADNIVDECFVLKGQSGFKFKPVPEQTNEFSIEDVSDFYEKELGRFHQALNKDLLIFTEYPLIRRKYFMPVFGAKRWEIFKYSVEYWKKYEIESEIKFPYLLDGLIYHPLEQSYVTNMHESKYREYKWKPPNKNSIDFYIEFRKDPHTGKILRVYDNSMAIDDVNVNEDIEDTVRNKLYRICTLHVGKTIRNKEQPVPFEENHGVYEAYIYEENGELRDITGDIISDKTVVEFYYKYDDNMIPQRRWIPIRTRYDKTESVERYNRKYGNYIGTAERIWRSIINPVLMDDFVELSKGNTSKRNFYDIKINSMNAKISHQLIVAVNRENKYYQKITKLASVLRQYHNFVKSNLIYTYCNKMYQSNNQQSVLDIACGRGGDINKFYYTEVAYYVGIDIDDEGLKSPVDGAISRYNRFRKKKPNYPKMYFLQADARALLNYESQVKILSGMDDINKKLLEKFFPKSGKKSLFDIISCQFAMHYFLKDELSWNNFKNNIRNHLRSGGYFIATTFDSKLVIDAIGDNDSLVNYYDDSNGNKKKFFEIIKRYDSTENITVGSAIDIYMSWIFNEGTYVTEYLVNLEFVVKEFLNIGLELVDTDTFGNQLALHKNFITDASQYDSSKETRSYLAKISQFYEKNEMNEKLMLYSKLNRYMIFRKIDPNDVHVGKKQKGGKNIKSKLKHIDISLDTYNFSDPRKYTIPDMGNYNDKYSMINSVHKLLVSHSIFPRSVGVDEFMRDMGIEPRKDYELSKEYFNDIVSNIIINHEFGNEGKTKNIINGLNIFVIERDCNNFYDIEYSVKNNFKKSDKAIVLMKEGGLYKPVMRNDDMGIRGIFRMNDNMISYLMKNGQKNDMVPI